jgi:hypothetical protein
MLTNKTVRRGRTILVTRPVPSDAGLDSPGCVCKLCIWVSWKPDPDNGHGTHTCRAETQPRWHSRPSVVGTSIAMTKQQDSPLCFTSPTTTSRWPGTSQRGGALGPDPTARSQVHDFKPAHVGIPSPSIVVSSSSNWLTRLGAAG